MTSRQLSAFAAVLVVVGGLVVATVPGVACASAQQTIAGDGGTCSPTPVCDPGVVEVCGSCGKATCDPCGQWGPCTEQGICRPGEEGQDGCYGGQNAVCNASCEWVCP